MWDGWETKYGSTRRVIAELPGYRRIFNKASIMNWGTKANPCPTLNLEKAASAVCRGIAFEFPNGRGPQVRDYLVDREGQGFVFRNLPIRIEGGSEAIALVSLYKGKNVLPNVSARSSVRMISDSTVGTSGSCKDYVRGIANELSKIGIDDPVVTELVKAITQ
jgi:cation transport protein ChaC